MKKRFVFTLKDRLVLALLALPLFLLLLLPFDYATKKRTLQEHEEQVDTAIEKTSHQIKKQAVNQILRDHYTSCDPNYLTARLESLPLLKKEKESLNRQATLQLPGVERLKERLSFLENENKLAFTDKGGERKEGIQEKVLALKHPVEVDSSDLREILKRLEEKEDKAPFLLISSMKLKRKAALTKNEVYDLQLELLKREFCAP